MNDAARDTTLILVHQDDDGPGNLIDWLDAHSLTWRIASPQAGLPAAEEYRALVILGSSESVFDRSVGWIPPEIDFVRRCIALGTPTFGICFGAQILATAFGGQVRRAPSPEYGWIEADGNAPYAGTWFSWHRDRIELPSDSETLAQTEAAVQSFSIGGHLGVQFHPELNSPQIHEWLTQERRMNQLTASGQSAEEVLRRTDERSDEALVAAHNLYASFFYPPRT